MNCEHCGVDNKAGRIRCAGCNRLLRGTCVDASANLFREEPRPGARYLSRQASVYRTEEPGASMECAPEEAPPKVRADQSGSLRRREYGAARKAESCRPPIHPQQQGGIPADAGSPDGDMEARILPPVGELPDNKETLPESDGQMMPGQPFPSAASGVEVDRGPWSGPPVALGDEQREGEQEAGGHEQRGGAALAEPMAVEEDGDLFDTQVERPEKEADQTRLSLIVQDHGGNVLHVQELRVGRTLIGREEGDLVFRQDPFMSPLHAALTWDGVKREVRVVDLKSFNGVFVQRMGAVRLEDGDQFLVGSQLFVARVGWENSRCPSNDGTLQFGSATAPPLARLINRRVGGGVVGVHFVQETLIIGKEGQCAYPEDAVMARHHVQVDADDDGIWIHDLGTGRGVFVRVSEEWDAVDGELILLGTRLLRVKFH